MYVDSHEYTHRSPELYYSLQGRFQRIYVQCNTIVWNVCARATAIFHRLPVESSNFGDIIRVSRCKTCDPNIVGTHPSVDPMVNGLRSGSNRQYWSVCPSTHRYINRAVVAAHTLEGPRRSALRSKSRCAPLSPIQQPLKVSSTFARAT